MDAEAFRALALALPEAVEGEHMSHPDFRVGGRIFATLHADGLRGVVMLAPDDQAALVAGAPGVFVPVSGAWGRRGATEVVLASARTAPVRRALALAWRGKAPRALRDARGGDARA